MFAVRNFDNFSKFIDIGRNGMVFFEIMAIHRNEGDTSRTPICRNSINLTCETRLFWKLCFYESLKNCDLTHAQKFQIN